MLPEDWQTLWFTIRVAALSVICILPPGILLAWLLARFFWWGKSCVETLVSLPLVVPPVATGLLLLKLLGRRGALGGWLYDRFGIELVFSTPAVVIALGVMAFPLLVRSARTAFEEVPPRLESIARTLGRGPMAVFVTVSLPLARRGIIGGTVLAFARALGEFGATIMVAGYIQGKTTTLSLAIYQSVQAGEDEHALRLIGLTLAIGFVAVWISQKLAGRAEPR